MRIVFLHSFPFENVNSLKFYKMVRTIPSLQQIIPIVTISANFLLELIMDLSKLTNERKLYLCRWYFRAGFALLPFLWAVNAIWFIREAFIVPAYEEQKYIKRYVIFSGIGAILWTIALVAWIVTFQTQRAAWGEFADHISYIIPVGIP